MPKRLIICCDGTWNSSDSGEEGVPSNVALLSRMLAPTGQTKMGNEIDQVVYYQTGVGTGPTTGISGHVESMLEAGTGRGVEDHVIQAYHFVATNYNKGDEVLLFGFSRGAYTTRAVGGLLTQMGLLNTVDLVNFNKLYRCFKAGQADKLGVNLQYSYCNNLGKELSKEEVDALIKKQNEDTSKYPKQLVFHTPTIPPPPKSGIMNSLKSTTGIGTVEPETPLVLTAEPSRIDLEVIGVWDTVGALGMPESAISKVTGVNKGKDFGDTALNKHVKRAYQALSLDDHRGAFTPSLWYLKDPLKKAKDKSARPLVDLKDVVDLRQCWFPGFHADIGGGCDTDDKFEKDKKAHSISQISLAWMCDQIDGLVTFRPDVGMAFLPDPEPLTDVWMARKTTDPMTKFYSTNTGGGSHLRTPGIYNRTDLILTVGNDGEEINENEKQGGQKVNDQHTRERMHPSIRLLMEATSQFKPKGDNPNKAQCYNPPALDKSGSTPAWTFAHNHKVGHGATVS
ncbi:hypothetical protein B0J14DRAFT_220477 [Halenospora varia]|nr:hypothetical protein B0J14DRAFT_220477 [Halenospora varia]